MIKENVKISAITILKYSTYSFRIYQALKSMEKSDVDLGYVKHKIYRVSSSDMILRG